MALLQNIVATAVLLKDELKAVWSNSRRIKMAEKRKSIKDPMKSGKDFGSPFDIFKAKLNKETVKSLKQPTGGLTGKRSKYSASPSVKLKKETIKKLAGNKTQAQKAKTKAKLKLLIN